MSNDELRRLVESVVRSAYCIGACDAYEVVNRRGNIEKQKVRFGKWLNDRVEVIMSFSDYLRRGKE